MIYTARSSMRSATAMVLLATIAAGQEPPSLRTTTLTEHDVTLTLPPLQDLDVVKVSDELTVRAWTGQLGSSRVDVAWHVLPARPWRISEPEQILELFRCSLSAPRRAVCSHHDLGPHCASMQTHFDRLGVVCKLGNRQTWRGAFGASSFAGFATGPLTAVGEDRDIGRLYALGGMLADASYLFQVACRPALDATSEARLLDWLRTGVDYRGAPRNPRWTDAELQRRWTQDVPESLRLRRVLRTRNFVVMTTSSAGRCYGRRLDRVYRQVRDRLPFEDDPGRRLLPVYLFRDKAEYNTFAHAFHVHGTIGHARADYFATYYASPTDRVHAHEAVHQIVANRLFALGGPGWVQEGLAEYLASARWQRMQTKQIARRLQIGWSDLTGSYMVRSYLSGPYDLQALAIGFLAESPGLRPSLAELLEPLCKLPIQSPRQSLAAVSDLLGLTPDELDRRWREYCDSDLAAKHR